MRFLELEKDMSVVWKERSCRVAALDDFTLVAYIQCPGTPEPIPVEAQELEPAPGEERKLH